MYCSQSSSPTFEGCIFANNATPGRGGGLYSWNGCAPTLTNCTFYGNSGSLGGGISSTNSSTVTAANTIVSFSTGGQAVYCDGTSSASLTCSDIYGNAGGDWVGCIAALDSIEGNFSDDPLFCDTLGGDFHLQETSPCAPAQQPVCGLIGALDPGCYLGIPGWGDTPGAYVTRLSVGPNPSQTGTRIVYEVPGEQGERQPVTLRVYDATGRHVSTLIYGRQSAGMHTADWNGLGAQGSPRPPGVYFCRLKAGTKVMTQKIVLLR